MNAAIFFLSLGAIGLLSGMAVACWRWGYRAGWDDARQQWIERDGPQWMAPTE